MQYRALGRTGVQVSPLCLGVTTSRTRCVDNSYGAAELVPSARRRP
jgi:aryl-alcohol dehydrogenase-like predicted oxidoreductase